MTYDLRPTEATDERLHQYAELLCRTFGSDRFTLDYLRWQYRDNPHGQVVGTDAWAGDELAAHYVTIPVSYSMFGEVVPGVLSLNTATHPNHQGKGLFTKLASQTYESAAAAGHRFVIGVANQNSTHGFTKRLGFTLLGPLEVRVGIGSVHADADGAPVHAAWTDEALAWRLAMPGTTYGEQRGMIWTPDPRPGVGVIMGTPGQGGGVQLERRRRPPLTVWIGRSPRPKIRGLLTHLPMRFRPSPLNLIIKDLSEGTQRMPSVDEIHLDLLDFDAY